MTSSRYIAAFAFHCLWHVALAVRGDIEAPKAIQMGKPLKVSSTVEKPEGGLVTREWGWGGLGAAQLVDGDDKNWHAFPPRPAEYVVTLAEAVYSPEDGGKLTIHHYSTTIKVTEGAPPDDVPEVKPLPKVEPAVAATLAQSFRATADFLTKGLGPQTVGKFREYLANVYLADGVPADAPIVAAIAERLNLGADADPLPASLPDALRKIAAELGGEAPVVTPPPTEKVTAVVYVYEKDDTVPPNPVRAAIDKLNDDGKVIATAVDDDIVDGDGDAPDQYVDAFAEARKAGLPALVVMSGRKVLRVIKSPTTEAAVMEAVR